MNSNHLLRKAVWQMPYINENELTEKAEKYSGNAMMIHTDKFGCCRFDGIIPDIEHLLEIRIFNEEKEFKALRPDISKDFVWRELSDNIGYDGNYDEIQYLDIDTTKSGYTFIGGGTYTMPESGLEKAVIRHYFTYDEDGLEKVVDERIVKFLKKGEEWNEIC